ncbi:Ubiquitin C-terminal hydrolase 22 [Trebouxia sp. C0009 RCD-2024]
MWWFKNSQLPVSLPEPLSSEEQKRIKRKCVASLKALQSCLRANPGLPLASKHLESRAIECFAEVAAPQQAQAYKACYLAEMEDQEHPDYTADACQAYVTAMADALRARHCHPLP